MKCTNCNTDASLLHGFRWNQKYGYIINDNELLCDKCAEQRPGFLQSNELLLVQEKQLKSFSYKKLRRKRILNKKTFKN